uniref:UDP-N-acetyl-D-mannosamine dehydrogenase n=1 Tax=uncultured marine thaumarchaeote KM3_82_A11 TaxID=1456301 RepID=A0A075HUM7_9ARCH|nr:UDP-N-acetyl-D-mannosaminuronate dehydrogenase (wbpO) [uncultured marine thaumarchaeote KM3_82_A11]
MTKNLSLLDNSQIETHLTSNSLKIGVVGIGRIGLPTALYFANSGFETIGIDINAELVTMVNSGDYPLKDEPGLAEIFENVHNQKKLVATSDLSKAIPECDIILLSLPTPMDDKNIPDYAAFLSVGKSINKLLSNGQIVIVESTVEPGFIENELLQTIEGTNHTLKSGVDFHLAVCPETANPGEIMKDFKKLPRLVGSIDEKISSIVSQIYTHVFGVEIILMPNCKTANAVKLTTNVFRDVNIAFVNELALLFEKLGIDTYTVIDAAKKKYNFQPHFPGPGVGGPCLPVNSYQYLNSSKKIDQNFLKIVQEARRINENMPQHVVDLLVHAFSELNKQLDNSTIGLLGISYKPNVRDVQIAPSEAIIKLLNAKNVKLKIFDPYFMSETVFGHKIENSISDAIIDSDAVIIITGHKEFEELNLETFSNSRNKPILVDCTGKINPKDAKSQGIIFRGIGRGNYI